jgi:hypothetical protein
MVNIFAVSIITMLLIIVYRKLNNRYQETIFRNGLYKLRDELRLLALDKKVDVKSTAFDYTDFSITTAITKSYYFTVFYITINEIKHEKSKKDIDEYREIYNNLNKEISANKDLLLINRKRNILVRQYITGQNRMTIYIFEKIFQLIFGIKKIKGFIKNKVDSINFLPETSGISLC